MTLRIGRIAYLNVAPYFQYLRQEGFAGEIVAGVPSELNAMLADGSIDACPSSSFEYGLNADDYLLLPGLSISSIGPVHSLRFCHPYSPKHCRGILLAHGSGSRPASWGLFPSSSP